MLLSVINFSCSKKDSAPKLEITSSKTELKYNETIQLAVNVGNSNDYEWKSSDEFVGKINAYGKFEAAHIGETEITATKNGTTAKLKLLVTPTETLFIEPYVEIGASKAIIKSKEKRTLAVEVSNAIGYAEPASAIRGNISYLFGNNGGLTGCLVGFTETTLNAERVGRFYAERYKFEGSSDGVFFLSDKNKKYSLGIEAENKDYGFIVMYFKYTETVSAKVALFDKIKAKNNYKANF